MLDSNVSLDVVSDQADWVRDCADEYGTDLEVCPIKGYIQERGTHQSMSRSD